MKNKAISIVLLCVLSVLLIVAVAIFFSTQSSFDNMQNVDSSNDQLPGASVLAIIIGLMTVWFGFILGEFIVSMIGFVVSLVAIKIAPGRVLKGISIGFFVFYSLIVLVITAAIFFAVISIV